MIDTKVVGGFLVAMIVTASPWVEQANEYGMLITTVVGILVGLVTAWYMVLKACQLKLQLKRDSRDGTK